MRDRQLPDVKFVMLVMAEKTRTDWENFEAECPHCRSWNVFNRATDLMYLAPIQHMVVRCLNANCAREFAINGDDGGPSYRTVFFDSVQMRSQKRYGLSILMVVQSLEMFFSHQLEQVLVTRPLTRSSLDVETEDLNAVLNELHEAIRPWSGVQLRNVFLWCVIAPPALNDLPAVRSAIGNLKPHTRKVVQADIDSSSLDDSLKSLLRRLNVLSVFELRNMIVHKTAYRPTREESQKAYDEIGDLLDPLAEMLDV